MNGVFIKVFFPTASLFYTIGEISDYNENIFFSFVFQLSLLVGP